MKLPDHTDQELVLLLNKGDRNAFEQIYRRYVAELYKLARRNVSLKEDCEEIVQEVFESLWFRRQNLRIDSLQFYLRSMVRYKVIRYFRKAITRRKYAQHFLLFEAVYEQLGDEELDFSALQSTLQKAMGELPERCQEALKLRLTEDLSNGDIANRMNITLKTVEGYMFRAFTHIRSSYRLYAQAVKSVGVFLLAGILSKIL